MSSPSLSSHLESESFQQGLKLAFYRYLAYTEMSAIFIIAIFFIIITGTK